MILHLRLAIIGNVSSAIFAYFTDGKVDEVAYFRYIEADYGTYTLQTGEIFQGCKLSVKYKAFLVLRVFFNLLLINLIEF
jgi:hypothetical protein